MKKRGIFVVVVLLGVLTTPLNLFCQDVVPRAATQEEIEKQLEKGTPIMGKIFYNNKIICSFDSEKGGYGSSTRFLYPGKIDKWVHTSKEPTMDVSFSKGDDPSQLLLITSTELDTQKLLIFSSKPKKGAYTLHFNKPLSAGEYEFAVKKGNMVIFLGCGFVVD